MNAVRNGRRDQATRSRTTIETKARDARLAIHNAHVEALLRTDDGRRLTTQERRDHIGVALTWVQTAENDLRSLRAALEREALRLEETT